ncbi:hypothetical protein L6452_25373 [Arctium lappa]|uniref:Uncharacterized protein n=1 Tax=Arctium lappa TaxID=4217 RepID=A0ACB9AA70_ARCLA|nr:hypothetical protein L6452_25373 [Arctium lappa]
MKYLLGGLIQFWAPLKIAGRWILTTTDQPFLLYYGTDEDGIKKYRSCCEKYKYNIDVDRVEVEEDPTIISSGKPATAFLNRMPELLMDLKVARMSSLESSALECGLMYTVVLPVFYPSQSCCVGVLQCSTCSPYFLLPVFNLLNFELENRRHNQDVANQEFVDEKKREEQETKNNGKHHCFKDRGLFKEMAKLWF